MSRVDRLRERLHRRKRNRDRKRRKHQGHRARREAKAVRTLRARIRALLDRRHRLPRVMFDDTSVDLIPRSAGAVGGYVNGFYRTFQALRRRFPKARRVSIAVSSDVVADCLDVESGDATNADAPRWYRRFREQPRRRRRTPKFYTSVSNADALVNELAAAGISRGRYVLWLAHYGAGKHICGHDTCGLTRNRADGTQWTSSSHERSLDESYLRPSFWRH